MVETWVCASVFGRLICSCIGEVSFEWWKWQWLRRSTARLLDSSLGRSRTELSRVKKIRLGKRACSSEWRVSTKHPGKVLLARNVTGDGEIDHNLRKCGRIPQPRCRKQRNAARCGHSRTSYSNATPSG